MKDFLPVFMSSYVFWFILAVGRRGLWWMKRLSSCRASRWWSAWRKKKRCSPLNVPPSPSPSSLPRSDSRCSSGQKNSSIHRQITFPAALPSSLCRFFLLSPCLRWEKIAETKYPWRTCFSSSIQAPSSSSLPPPPSSVLLSTWRASNKTKSRCLVTAPVSVGVLPEGKPVSMTQEPPEEHEQQQQHRWWAKLLSHWIMI